MSRLEFINVVYGGTFTQFFLDVSLPSQLAPGNLPALQQRAHSVHSIYTTEGDAGLLTASPAYRRLVDLMPVNLVMVDLNQLRDQADRERAGATVWSVLSLIHKRAIQQARHDHLIFLAPDWVIADGSFRALEGRFDQGFEVVVSGPRVEQESAEPMFRSQVSERTTLTVPPHQLVDIMLQFPHPVQIALSHEINWRADLFHSLWPSILTWRHPKVGFINHSGHLHPIAVRRERGNTDFATTIDGDYLSSFEIGFKKVYVATDSDEICISDVTPQHAHADKVGNQPAGIFYYAEWLIKNIVRSIFGSCASHLSLKVRLATTARLPRFAT